MVLRSVVHRWIRTHDRDRRSGPPLGTKTKWALYFAVICAVWIGFKTIEPHVFPVIKDFTITKAIHVGENVAISGELNKVRACRILDIVGYSGKQYITVIYQDYPEALISNRLVRSQTYGPWILIPNVPEVELYAQHLCTTGVVTTKLFQGAIVGVSQ